MINNHPLVYHTDEDGNESVYINGRAYSDELTNELDQINKAINLFTEEMRAKMHAKAIAGLRGWNNPEDKIMLRNLLQEHVSKDTQTAKQMVDVANIAMMLWWIEILEDGNPTPPPSIVETFNHLRQELGHHIDGIDSPDDLLET